jgi:hypothetical protein
MDHLHRRRMMAARRGFMVTAALLALAISCSGGEDVPEGFADVSGPTYAFAYPEQWQVADDADLSDGVVVFGDPGPGTVRPQATLVVDETFTGDFDTAVDGLLNLASVEFENREVVGDETIDVPGAAEARLLEATYVEQGDGGEAVVVRQYDLFAVDQQGNLVYLYTNAAEEDFDDATFRAIVESLELTA